MWSVLLKDDTAAASGSLAQSPSRGGAPERANSGGSVPRGVVVLVQQTCLHPRHDFARLDAVGAFMSGDD